MQLLVISLSLALDAFSVSVVGGVKIKKIKAQDALKIALFFGGFQFLMPIIGWVLGVSVHAVIYRVDHWIAFFLLFIIGVKLIKESFQSKEQINVLDNKTLFLLAIATSIDSLAIGVTLDFIGLPLLLSATSIGIVTFILCFVGFIFGRKLGTFFESKIEALGGVGLIVLAFKILFDHLTF